MSTISAVSCSSDAWASMKAQRSQMQAKMFAKADTNNSGGVDKTELQSLLDDGAKKTGVTNSSSTDKLFSKMDANGDGSLSADELSQGMKSIMPAPPSTMDFAQSHSTTSSSNSTSADDLFGKVDTNADGSLSQSEFEAGRKQADHGAPATGAAPPPPPPDGAGSNSTSNTASSSTTYDPLDTNKDGVVSTQERLAGSSSSTSTDAVQTLLKAIDSDSDGKISASESDTFIKKLSSQLDAQTQSLQNSGTSTNSSSASNNDNLDLVKLVQQAYEQIANNQPQHTKGSTLSTVA